MHRTDSCQEDQLNDATEYSNVLQYDETGDASWYKVEGGIRHKSEAVTGPGHGKIENPQKIRDFEVPAWLDETRRLTGEARGSYRLVVVENPSGPTTKFPITKDRLSLMLRTWEFPPLRELLHAIHYGGSAVFKTSSNARRNFLIGGGVFICSIGAIISYDEGSRITTGCIILGKGVKWPQRARDEFRQSFPDTDSTHFNPLSIPILIASILMDTLRMEREKYLNKIIKMDGHIEETVQQRNREPWSQRLLLKDHRSFFHESSKRQQDLGRIQTLIERSNLIVKFAAETDQSWQGPQVSAHLHERIQIIQNSLQHMSVEINILRGRLESQVMIIGNLITQQDIVLTCQIAEDSKAIAAATRRDGVAMKIIAGGGAVFLPATVISAFLALLQLQWNAGEMIIVYFAITIPFTVLVLGVVYGFWRLLDEKLEIEVYKTKERREAGYKDSRLTAPQLTL